MSVNNKVSRQRNLPAVPALGGEASLNRYLSEIKKFPVLAPEQEYMLAKAWVDRQDSQAAHQLVTSHLRLAAKIAMGYRGYGLPQAEVVASGPGTEWLVPRCVALRERHPDAVFVVDVSLEGGLSIAQREAIGYLRCGGVMPRPTFYDVDVLPSGAPA